MIEDIIYGILVAILLVILAVGYVVLPFYIYFSSKEKDNSR